MSDYRVEIVFNNQQEIFGPNDFVAGKIHITANKQTTFKEIRVKMAGEARIQWFNRSYTAEEDIRPVTYRNFESYFETNLTLASNLELPSCGQKIFDFSTTLPSTLPASFEGRDGCIRYYVKCTVDRAWKLNDRFVKPFTVVAPVDLNHMDEAKTPLLAERNVDVSLCCFGGTEIGIKITCPFSGYAPGQTVPVDVTITNNSSSQIHGSDLRLHKQIVYRARGDKRKDLKPFKKITLGAVKPASVGHWTKDIKIPAIPPTGSADCKYLSISYFFKVKTIGVSGTFNRNMELRVPVIIGTIPLTSSIQNSGDVQSRNVQPEGKAVGWMNRLGCYPQIRFPRFERSEFGGVQNERDKHEIGFYAPSYPVYWCP